MDLVRPGQMIVNPDGVIAEGLSLASDSDNRFGTRERARVGNSDAEGNTLVRVGVRAHDWQSFTFLILQNMTLQVKQISSDEAKAHAFAIRMRVFVSEQRVPRDIELDDDDEHAIHFL